MAEEVIVKAVKRVAGGTGAARRLRRAGMIPAVVYGNTEPMSIELNAHDFEMILQHNGQNFVADLNIEGETSQKVLLKDAQHNPLSGVIIHADFVSISMTELLELSLPIELIGEPVGAVSGGTLEQLVSEIQVTCLPADMVENITVDVSALEIGDHMTVADITLPKGVTVLTDVDVAVAAVAAPRVEEEEEEEEGDEEGAEEGAEGAAPEEETAADA